MGQITRSCLRIFTDAATKEEIDSSLGLRAHTWHPRDSRIGRINEQLTGHPWAVWRWDSNLTETLSPHEHVAHLCTFLQAKAEKFQGMVDRGWQPEILLTCSSDSGQGGLTLSVDLLGALAGLSVGFAVNVLLSDASQETGADPTAVIQA